MKQTQQGFGLVFLIVTLAVMAIIAALYFTQSGDNQTSQYEISREALEQAKQINQQKVEDSKAIQRQNQLKNELEGN